ncbi:hypothetical protein [Bradyrhizobium sp. LTSPM299]|uniref:hypothetical protein n=1 Tax=Bradyrhizobium sp. LTSPM299 TaxID=1619233 RepID=UPI0009E4D8DB|nr:hypothetical protein [Bradyrhizobium sp. LTSPM299]
MTDSELHTDIHSIAPIPDADRSSTGLQQMWIWAGANIAPVNTWQARDVCIRHRERRAQMTEMTE